LLTITPEYKEKIELNKGDDGSVIPFEIHIPKEVRGVTLENILNIAGCLRQKSIYHRNCLIKEDRYSVIENV
jgi:hypothetical protein